MSLKKNLNEEQEKAVTHTSGPALVLAGAGSGKTRVITYRIVYLLEQKDVKPYNILAVTFTNKAADEMKERLYSLVRRSTKGIWMGTFHSICARLLREFASCTTYSRNFIIYDTQDQHNLIKNIIRDSDIGEKTLDFYYVHRTISNLKNRLIDEYEFKPYNYKTELIKNIYQEYQTRLKENDAMDFDDLLFNFYTLLDSNTEIRKNLNDRFKYKLVDEYQDTNPSQYQILKKLSERYKDVFVVGDDDQSIYGFRGADINNILDFEDDFPNSKVYKLERNYRSTKRILEVASTVVKNNRLRKGKTLWTKEEEGEKITLFSAFSEKEEAAKLIKLLKKELGKYNKKDILIAYRTNAQSRAIEDALLKEEIPYVIVGGVKFYQRKEIKDILSYVKFIVNKKDTVSFFRILNTPRRGIGKITREKTEMKAKEENISLWEASCKLAGQEQPIADFVNLIKSLEEIKRIDELIVAIVEKTGYVDILKETDTIESESRIENIQELLSAAYEFTENSEKYSPEEYLTEVGLKTDIDSWSRTDSVNLMTLHNTKGLEFDVVFIVGIGEGLLPHYRSIKEGNTEEERRLFYVGITRARKKLFLSYFLTHGAGWGSTRSILPSSFLKELPPGAIENLEDYTPGGNEKKQYILRDNKNDSKWVNHPIFGRGEILDVVDGDKLLISFNGTTKKIKRRFFDERS
ncbi:UvrD-helicase domain-containing protein [candidate division WOR-3 bacterium]|nr:UvrD-helicase domain-containing protein [candidate division WOR-3 bacterium]